MNGATSFKDHFSTVSVSYARFRPAYPDALFDWLAARCPARGAAWDCGTGTGQAALALADRFDRVLATDPSAEQILGAAPHPGVVYSRAPAEASGLPDASVDLVTVAQALHWFDLDRFYREVRRVARPGAVVAAWCYTRAFVSPAVDPVVDRYSDEGVGPFWPPERRHVENGYRDLPFPFQPLETPTPPFDLEVDWDLDHLVGYLRTWSATVQAARVLGRDPLATTLPALRDAWGEPSTIRRVRWPLGLRVGRR